jgi:hypothetical protein
MTGLLPAERQLHAVYPPSSLRTTWANLGMQHLPLEVVKSISFIFILYYLSYQLSTFFCFDSVLSFERAPPFAPAERYRFS